MHQATQHEFQPGCQGISGTFIKPPTTFREAADHLFLATPSAMSSRKDEEGSGGYFSFKPRTPPSPSMSAAPTASSNSHDQQVALLTADADIMGNRGAAKWRKVATTMPKSLWKSEADATSCDHLSTVDGACEKPFGRFLGKYKIPWFPSWSPSLNTSGSETPGSVSAATDSSASSSTSSLWGSVKTNRRIQCWRCGNCFCDDHGSQYATLILDREDALQFFPSEPEAEEASVDVVSQAALEDLAVDMDKQATQDLQAPIPVRTAAMALSQYLAASPQSHSSNGGSHTKQGQQQQQQTLKSRIRLYSTHSHSSSHHSDDWHSAVGGSPSSARMPTPDVNSSHASARNTPGSAFSETFASAASSSQSHKARQNSTTSSLLALSKLPSRAVSPMTERMAQLPDGRLIVRERVCLRCHDIVEQAKDRAVHKQAKRKQELSEFAFALESLGGFVALDPVSGEFTAETDEDLATLYGLFEQSRQERKRAAAAAAAAAAKANQDESAPRPESHGMTRQQSLPCSRNQVDVDHDSDDDDDSSSASSHSYHHYHQHTPHTNAYPARVYLRSDGHDTRNHQAATAATPHTLPRLGMGGQRLQWAIAPYQR